MDQPTMPDTITFERWDDPVVEHFQVHPTGSYSRAVWLPLLGPTSWVILGTLAEQLADQPSVTWVLEDLAQAHGIGHLRGSSSLTGRTLRRLAQFGAVRTGNGQIFQVRTALPPLTRRQLRRSPDRVLQLHQALFGYKAETS